MLKRFSKVIAIVMIIVLSTVGMASALTSEPDERADVDGFTMTYFDDNMIVCQWPLYESTYNTCVGYHIVENGEIIWQSDNPYAYGAYFTDMTPGIASRLTLYAEYKNSYGELKEYYMGSTYVNTTPYKLKKADFNVDYVYNSSKTLNFVVAPANQSGTEFQLKTLGGTTIATKSSTGKYSKDFAFEDNKAYKYRARTYYTNSSTAETYKGKWSSYRYFLSPRAEGKYTYGVVGLNVKIWRNKSVDKFKIYVSTDREKLGTLTKTVRITDTTTKTVKINKIGDKSMSKGKTYYVTIVPVIKDNGNTYASDVKLTLNYYC